MRSMCFSKSLVVAIRFLMVLISGQLESDHLTKPNWKDFDWFRRIKPGKISKGGRFREKATEFQELQRKVSFFGHENKKVLLAVVRLKGFETENPDGTKPTFWKVVSVGYRPYHDSSTVCAHLESENWIDVELDAGLADSTMR